MINEPELRVEYEKSAYEISSQAHQDEIDKIS
jgi:hypothetical protein